LKSLYWGAFLIAVALTAGVWFRLVSAIVPTQANLANAPSLKGPPTPAERAQAKPSPALLGLRERLPELTRGADASAAAAVTAFYTAHNGPLLWTTREGFSPRAATAIAELRKAADWGLDPADFAIPGLPPGTISPASAAEAEVRLSLALL
jgi:hypothetical protein